MAGGEEAKRSSRAAAYAAWVRAGRDRSFGPMLEAVVELLLPPPIDVLDVGCGEGRLGRALSERGYTVLGVDAEPTMVALAAEHHEARLADATALPFTPGRFDAVVTAHVLMEISDLDTALGEIARVTRPGGMLVASVEHPFSSGARVECYSRPQHQEWLMSFDGVDLGLGGIHRPLVMYVRALERAGFDLVSLREAALEGLDPLSLVLSARRRRPDE